MCWKVTADRSDRAAKTAIYRIVEHDDSDKEKNEGQPQRQEDLRQVQGYSP